VTAARTRTCKAETNLLGSLNPRPVWDVQESEDVFHEGSNVDLGIDRIKWQDIGRRDTYPYFESRENQQATVCIGRADRRTAVMQCEMEKLNVNTGIIWTLRRQALQPVSSESS